MKPRSLVFLLMLSLLFVGFSWAQTPITKTVVLETPGDYVLAADLILPANRLSGVGIEVAVSGVTITNPDSHLITGRNRFAHLGDAFGTDQVGIRVRSGVTNVRLVGLKIDSCYIAIDLGGSDCTVENCEVFNCKYGVFSSGVGNTISKNVLEEKWHNQFFPIHLYGAQKNTVEGNRCVGGAVGIGANGSGHKIVNNVLLGNVDGVAGGLYNSEISGNAGSSLHFGVYLGNGAHSNFGTDNSIVGQFSDPNYPNFDPDLVGCQANGNNVTGPMVKATSASVTTGVDDGWAVSNPFPSDGSTVPADTWMTWDVSPELVDYHEGHLMFWVYLDGSSKPLIVGGDLIGYSDPSLPAGTPFLKPDRRPILAPGHHTWQIEVVAMVKSTGKLDRVGGGPEWSFEIVQPPANFVLDQNQPNPFNATTAISYSLAIPSNVYMAIYNIRGQLIKVLVSSYQQPGSHRVIWDGTDELGQTVPSSVYFCRTQFDPGGNYTVSAEGLAKFINEHEQVIKMNMLK